MSDHTRVHCCRRILHHLEAHYASTRLLLIPLLPTRVGVKVVEANEEWQNVILPLRMKHTHFPCTALYIKVFNIRSTIHLCNKF